MAIGCLAVQGAAIQRQKTHSDEIGAVVVEDGFNFKLLSADRRVRQLQIDEEVLPDNDLQRGANADTCSKSRVWKKQREG